MTVLMTAQSSPLGCLYSSGGTCLLVHFVSWTGSGESKVRGGCDRQQPQRNQIDRPLVHGLDNQVKLHVKSNKTIVTYIHM
jgi:hypothetical protein